MMQAGRTGEMRGDRSAWEWWVVWTGECAVVLSAPRSSKACTLRHPSHVFSPRPLGAGGGQGGCALCQVGGHGCGRGSIAAAGGGGRGGGGGCVNNNNGCGYRRAAPGADGGKPGQHICLYVGNDQLDNPLLLNMKISRETSGEILQDAILQSRCASRMHQDYLLQVPKTTVIKAHHLQEVPPASRLPGIFS